MGMNKREIIEFLRPFMDEIKTNISSLKYLHGEIGSLTATLDTSNLSAQEMVQIYNEVLTKDRFVEVLTKRNIDKDSAEKYWNIIDTAIESEQP